VYIEGIRASTALGDCRIVFEVDPSGTGDYMVMDAVRVTTFSLDIDTDSNNNGSIDQSEEGFEEFAPGRVLCIDLEGDGPSLDDLAPIALRAPNVAYGLVKLEAVEGADRVRLWKDTDKMEEVVLPVSWTPPDVPTLLYADGIALGQVKLRLSYVIPTEHELASDTIALFVTETISYAPSGCVMTWEPCSWGLSDLSIPSGAVDLAVAKLKDEYCTDTYIVRLIDNTPPPGAEFLDYFGDCTLAWFKRCGYAGVTVVSGHGGIGAFFAVWASTHDRIQNWIMSEGGIVVDMLSLQDQETGWYTAAALSGWFSVNWKQDLDQNKALVVFLATDSAEGEAGSSCVASAGGRVGFGYVGEACQDEFIPDLMLLLGRMNGTGNGGEKRTVGKAYGDRTGYSWGFRMLGNGCGETHKWTVLCPSPNAVFPTEAVGNRRGAGCIIFDTYMDTFYPADDAVISASGQGVSSRRWFGNPSAPYCVSFDFDKRNLGGILMRAVAENCAANNLFWGYGSKLDGDRVAPNRDDLEWQF
jgi:hypothetical protein